MSNTSKPNSAPPAKPGLLTEDRNAAVRTHKGVQTIVKVPSRAAEAQRQGVKESKI